MLLYFGRKVRLEASFHHDLLGHCLQIEIGRALYMDERSFERKPFLGQLIEDMRDLAIALADIDLALLAAA